MLLTIVLNLDPCGLSVKPFPFPIIMYSTSLCLATIGFSKRLGLAEIIQCSQVSRFFCAFMHFSWGNSPFPGRT